MFETNFINAGTKYSTTDSHVPAPYFRREFVIKDDIKEASIKICGLGFYKLYINGVDITKGHLAPYRSNPDHFIYADIYDVSQYLQQGHNVMGILLGNGMQNPLGGRVWGFDEATWRNSPQVSFDIQIEYINGEKDNVTSDESTKTMASPILFDDLHWGEFYDARKEIEGWNRVEYDDSKWQYAKKAPTPRGALRVSEAEPLVVRQELMPIDIMEYESGYIYDFGINTSGVCKLTLENGKSGQTIKLQHCEVLVEGKPFFDGIRFDYMGFDDPYQEDVYVSAGKEKETYIPSFTYHGFRYVYVTGITKEQAKASLLTYLEICSDLKIVGKFECSDKVANAIQEATVRSDYSNFHYFPTDCPQREKNGWTADAALSAEQMLLNLTPENSFREWMRNIYKAMTDEGKIPGVIPTNQFGYEWGNGPAWDSVIVYLPYYTYRYRGDKTIIEECANPLMRYLTYLYSKLDERDLIEIGLGDWCQTGHDGEDFDTPLVVTDSIYTIDIARKAEFIYEVLGMAEQKEYAKRLAAKVSNAFREHLIDRETLIVKGDTQTAQAMALYHDLFEPSEQERAFHHLLKLIDKAEKHMETGVLGARVLFRVLAENGYADLAYQMIVREDFPSYGNWIARGATTLWEVFLPEGDRILSMNHHFWGDVSAWFYYYPGGIHFNPTGKDITHLEIKPCFIKALQNVDVKHTCPSGDIKVVWERVLDNIRLCVEVPKKLHGKIILPEGYVFEDGQLDCKLETGVYTVGKRSCYEKSI